MIPFGHNIEHSLYISLSPAIWPPMSCKFVMKLTPTSYVKLTMSSPPVAGSDQGISKNPHIEEV